MDGLPDAARAREAKETSRVEALTDGIFAIAMTLLVLDIHVPAVEPHQTLVAALLDDWTTYIAFLIGFFTLLVCWINHHYMFELIRKSDGPLLLLNGFKLLVVSFTPFATSLLSRYIETGHEQAAVNVYTGNFFLMGLSMTLVFCYAAGRNYLIDVSPAVRRMSRRLYIFATLLSGAIFAVSFLNVWASLALFCLMFAVFVFPKGLVQYLAQREGGRRDTASAEHVAIEGERAEVIP